MQCHLLFCLELTQLNSLSHSFICCWRCLTINKKCMALAVEGVGHCWKSIVIWFSNLFGEIFRRFTFISSRYVSMVTCIACNWYSDLTQPLQYSGVCILRNFSHKTQLRRWIACAQIYKHQINIIIVYKLMCISVHLCNTAGNILGRFQSLSLYIVTLGLLHAGYGVRPLLKTSHTVTPLHY